MHILALEYVLFLFIIQSFQVTLILLLPFLYFKAVEDVYEQNMTEPALHVLKCDIKLKIESCRSELFLFSKDPESAAKNPDNQPDLVTYPSLGT